MTEQAIGQEIGRKLSAANVGWKKENILEAVILNKDKDIFLYRAIGVATGTKRYENDGQVGFGLIGQFQLTNHEGTEFNGSVLYLPGYVQDQIVAGLNLAGEGAGARIAVDVYARFDADAATSYVFVARSLLASDNQAVDEIKTLIGSMPLPALPAPAKKG